MLTRAKVDAFASIMLSKLQVRGEFNLTLTEHGVRVSHRYGTVNYPTAAAFLMTYGPEYFQPETEVKLTCPICGGWEMTQLKELDKDDRMRPHLPSDGGLLREVLAEEQTPLCRGSLKPGQRR